MHMQVEMWSLYRIKPYEKNPRINDDAVAAIVAESSPPLSKQTAFSCID